MSGCSFTDSEIAELALIIENRLGLSFPAARYNDLRRGLGCICKDFGMTNAAKCIETIQGVDAKSDLYEKLVAQLTIGETYFYRDPYVYEGLLNFVLPPMLQRPEKRVSVWSAGCSSGEEPYSLAMLAAHHSFSALMSPILATDISTQALEKARGGIYTEWSFRGTPAWMREGYFESQPNKRWRIDAATQRIVDFRNFNLVGQNWPWADGLVAPEQFDIILCRNVLIYFSAEVGNQVVRQFIKCLAPDGVLIVGPSELANLEFPGMKLEQYGDLMLFRKGDGSEPEAVVAPVEFKSIPLKIVVEPILAPGIPVATPVAVTRPTNSGELVENARKLCAASQFKRALDQCEKAIAMDPSAFDAYYLIGGILLEIGDYAKAGEAFSRALYLHPQHVLARFGLGETYRLAGDSNRALHELRLVRRYAFGLPRDQSLSHGEGLTAGVLCQLIDSSLARLTQVESL